MGNVETVQGIYEAFGRGDLAAVLAPLADDVVWDEWHGGNAAVDDGISYLRTRKGKDEVAAFFQEALEALTFGSFEPVAILAGGNQVAAVIRVGLTVNTTGKRFEDDELHLWTFDDTGNVTALRHFIDTHKHVRANG